MGLSRVTVAGLLALLLASCGGGGGSTSNGGGSSQSSNAPRIVGLTPASIPPGSDAFTLTVNGANFPSNAVIMFEQTQRPTAFVNSTQLTTAVSKDEVAQGHNIGVNVIVPNVAAANGVVFKVEFPQPTITSLSKTGAQVNDPGFTMTVTGANFFPGAHLQWDGIDRVTQVVSSTQLTAQIPSGDLGVGGNHTIRISNPQPNAGISAASNFFITAPVPTITAITPDPVIAATYRTSFTITGTNFFSATKVTFDGTPVFPQTVTPTQLTFDAAVPAKLGNVTWTVTNDGGGSASKTITLIPSENGIKSFPLFSNLVTDDLKWNVFSFQNGTSAGSPVYIPGVKDPCILGANCLQAIQTYPDLKSFVTNYQSYEPAIISADARYFIYSLSNRTMGGANVYYGPSFLFDTCRGATAGCAQMSYSYTVPGDGSAEDYQNSGASAKMSASGRYVAFSSWRADLVVGDTNAKADAFLRDMCLGAPAGCVPTNTLISAPVQVQGFAAESDTVRMSRDARFIYFYRHAANVLASLNVYDTCIGASVPCVPGETIANVDDTGAVANGFLGTYVISPDGRYVAFNTGQLVQTKLFVRDTCLGVTAACIPTTLPVNLVVAPFALSPGGKYIATETTQTFGNPTDTNGDPYSSSGIDIYVIGTCMGATTPCTQSASRVSVDAQGVQIGGIRPQFTPDGTRIIYNKIYGGWVITEPLTLP